VWRYAYRAIDQYGQVIDVHVSARRDAGTARRFFHRALATLKVKPVEVITDAAPFHPAVLDELIPSARHYVEQYANNPIDADHGRLKHRLRPVRGYRPTPQRRWSSREATSPTPVTYTGRAGSSQRRVEEFMAGASPHRPGATLRRSFRCLSPASS
jgi:transposase-like protein